MFFGKAGKGKGLCPFSLGIALGVTSGLAVFLWSLWMLYYGVPPMMAERVGDLTFMSAITRSLWVLVKGFIFGFFIAMIYNLVSCCCRAMCCKNGDANCQCGAGCKCCK